MDRSPLRPSQQSSVLAGAEGGGRQERGTKEEQALSKETGAGRGEGRGGCKGSVLTSPVCALSLAHGFHTQGGGPP